MTAKTPREDPQARILNVVPVGSNPSPAATFQAHSSPPSGSLSLHEAPLPLSRGPTGSTTGFRKGDRVEYTWSNELIGKPPFTDQGTVLVAHRDGSVTVKWDEAAVHYGHKMWCHSGMNLTRVNE